MAEQLASCKKGERCGCGACPICLRRVRCWLSGALYLLLITLGWTRGQGYAVSVIPTWLACQAGHLSVSALLRAEHRIRKAISRSVLCDLVIVGGWDFSWNEDSDGAWGPHWQPHLYLVFLGAVTRAQIERELKRIFPGSPTTPKPVACEPLKDPVEVITYAFKACFFRRIGYVRKDNGKRDTRKDLPLRPAQERELLTVLDQLTITGRLFLRNVRRRGGRLVALSA
ncbi:MAG: hypothetical protein EPN20_01545 [Magnetospirillum sp.]|nr:MAG: hypothetical protein EPN20_01545 [Magnetospirillum sp.]